jgi:predicted MFS family arabinose efflux permease
MTPLRFLFGLTLLGQSGFRGSRLLLSLFALELGASAFTVGLLLAVYSLTTAAFGWPLGKWSDRIGCRIPMLVASVVSAAGFCLPFLYPTVAALFVAAVINGVAYCMYHVAQMHAAGILSTAQTRKKNLANLSLMFSVTNFSGPLVAGFSIELVGHERACLVFAALSLLSALILVFGTKLLPRGSGHETNSGGSLRELLDDPRLLKILLVGSLVFAAIDVFQYYVPVYAHSLALSPAAVGMIMACFPAAAFISRVCLNWFMERSSVEAILRRSFLLASAAFMLFPFFENAYALAAIAFLYGFGLCVGQPLTLILAYENASKERAGEVIGIRESVNQSTRVVAPVVFGAIGSVTGLIPVFFIGAAMLGLGAFMLRPGNLSTAKSPPTAR